MVATYSLLRQFARTLVFAVTEEFDDTSLVWRKTTGGEQSDHLPKCVTRQTREESKFCDAPRDFFDNLPHESSPLAQVTFGA